MVRDRTPAVSTEAEKQPRSALHASCNAPEPRVTTAVTSSRSGLRSDVRVDSWVWPLWSVRFTRTGFSYRSFTLIAALDWFCNSPVGRPLMCPSLGLLLE